MSDQASDEAAHRTLASDGDGVPFKLRLAQTIAWCSPRVNPTDAGGSLRSEKLRPWVLTADRVTTVRHLLEERASTDPDVRSALPIRTVEGLGTIPPPGRSLGDS